MPINEFGQPVGVPVPGWTPRAGVRPVTLRGRWCRVEPLEERHLEPLFAEVCEAAPPQTWTYLSDGPFDELAGFTTYCRMLLGRDGWLPHAVCDAEGTVRGIACYLRDDPPNGSVEVGGITFGPNLQRSVAATEAMYLMARHVFEDLGYRRYEWKCDDLNAASRRAATRLGFAYEGTFRQAQVYKGRNRDTAWYSITDAEWEHLRPAYDAWLQPTNFDLAGGQRSALSAATAAVRAELPRPDAGTDVPDAGTGERLS